MNIIAFTASVVDTEYICDYFSELSRIAHKRFEQTGNKDDIDKAIDWAKRCIDLANNSNPINSCNQFPAELLHNLGNLLVLRFTRTLDQMDLEDAIKLARKVIESAPSGHPNLAAYLNNLGEMLWMRFLRRGEKDDIEEAMDRVRKAVKLTPDNRPLLVSCLSNLATILKARHISTGESNDIKEAIKQAKKAIKLTPENDPLLGGWFNNLGTLFKIQYERTENLEDLEEAIGQARKAVNLTPDDHPHLASWMNNLGSMLEIRYKHTAEEKDIKEAIQQARKAVELTPGDHPGLAGRLDNLGTKLAIQYQRTGEARYLKDHQEAIQQARKAVNLTPDDHPDLAIMLSNLGTKLAFQYTRTGEAKKLEEASAHLLKAWYCLKAVSFHRVKAAAQCMKLLAQQHQVDLGIDLGRQVLDLLPSVLTRALDRNDQQFVVSTYAGVASDLCALLLSANRPNEALECLEQGRAIIISQLLDDRSDLTSLRQDHSQLADRYQSLLDEVNASSIQTTLGGVKVSSRKRKREAAAELNTCLKKIRSVPDHGRFLLGQTIVEMQECITKGHIVIVNITDFRSDAIIISSKSLRTIALPEMCAAEARLWLRKDWSTTKKSQEREKNDQFLKYLSWLWDVCVKRIVAEIPAPPTDLRKLEGLPRVWWIGSGLASSMPFHAAGTHSKRSKENAYSRVISSYTPSIKALGYAQKQAERAQEALLAEDANKMLIAIMPTSPKGPSDKKVPKSLPGVKKEMREILSLTDSHIRTSVHENPSAAQVLEVLGTCRIAHFACHGISDYLDPSNSGLILQKSVGPDEALVQDRLTVQRVSDLQLRHAQIAYLSACSTAENKAARLSDEVIHVVSGFQVAGFPHVVGCLWPAGDSECAEVSKRFYSSIFGRNQRAIDEVALALQEAVMAVRAEDLSMPLNWAQFVHYGA